MAFSTLQPGGCGCGCGSTCFYCVKPRSICDGHALLGSTATLTDGAGNVVGTATSVSQVSGVSVTNGGTGWTSVPPLVSFSGGGGSGASAVAALGGGVLNAATVTAGGSGYTAPVVAFAGGIGAGAVGVAKCAVSALSLATGGSGYTFDAFGYALVFSGGGGGSGATGTFDVVGGVVMNLTLTAGGSLYTVAPTISFSAAGAHTAGAAGAATLSVSTIARTANGTLYKTPTVAITDSGAGAGATATATATAIVVASVAITNGGSGYSSAPTVTLAGGDGTGATAVAGFAVEACIGGGLPAGTFTLTTSASGYFDDVRTVGGPSCSPITVDLYPTGSASVTFHPSNPASGITVTTTSAGGTQTCTITGPLGCSVSIPIPATGPLAVTVTASATGCINEVLHISVSACTVLTVFIFLQGC